MPSKKIPTLRRQAFDHQHGRCWYCGVQMWLASPSELPGVPVRSASRLQCTAEHLQARCDGGTDVASNIVAACMLCNRTRHQRKKPPPPEAYLVDVRRRVCKGGWHYPWVRDLGLLKQASE